MSDTSMKRRTLWGRLKRYLLAGTLVTAPAFITLYTVIGIINIGDRWVKSLVPARFYPEMRFFGIPGIGLALLFVFLIFVGFLTTSWLGKLLVRVTDHFLSNTPVLSSLYSTLKQLFHTLLGDSTGSFREVVLVEFPRNGCWSIGFVTGASELASQSLDNDMIFVFIPTTPNPTNGYLTLFARDQVRPSLMTVEQGLKAVVSMGMTK